MNWYKNSQQLELFPEMHYEYNDLEYTDDIQEAMRILTYLKIPYEVVDFPKANSVLHFGNEIWDEGSVDEVIDWIYNISDMYLHDYVPGAEEDFWSDISDHFYVFHATSSENVQSILQNGLIPDCKTRSISNRSMGCGVFTSTNIDAISSYGDSIFQINVGAMKADDYMPEVSGEDPIDEAQLRNALAYKFGVEYDFTSEYSSEGLSEDTIVFFGIIPPKYLEQVQ